MSCCGAVRSGFVGVNATYRLAPQSPWPAGSEDVAAVVAWVAGQIGARGGDPARIYLMGHSAGAIHVANYVSHPEFYKVKDGGLAGAVMVCGLYELGKAPLGDGEIAYYGSDPSRYAECSALAGLLATKTPLMIADRIRRARPTPLHRTVRAAEAGHLPTRQRMRARRCCRNTATCRRSMRSTPPIRG
jgi:dienelactone hydrolase